MKLKATLNLAEDGFAPPGREEGREGASRFETERRGERGDTTGEIRRGDKRRTPGESEKGGRHPWGIAREGLRCLGAGVGGWVGGV